MSIHLLMEGATLNLLLPVYHQVSPLCQDKDHPLQSQLEAQVETEEEDLEGTHSESALDYSTMELIMDHYFAVTTNQADRMPPQLDHQCQSYNWDKFINHHKVRMTLETMTQAQMVQDLGRHTEDLQALEAAEDLMTMMIDAGHHPEDHQALGAVEDLTTMTIGDDLHMTKTLIQVTNGATIDRTTNEVHENTNHLTRLTLACTPMPQGSDNGKYNSTKTSTPQQTGQMTMPSDGYRTRRI